MVRWRVFARRARGCARNPYWLAHPPRTLPAWRAPKPEEPSSRRRAVVRRRRPTSGRAGARATTRPRSTSASRRRRSPATTPWSSPYEIAEPFVHGDARHMDAIVDGSVALVVTSPPYFAGKQYEEELERDGVPSSYVEYLQLLTDVFAECARKLEPGGRIAVNVANLGRKPYRSLAADVVHILQDDLQLLLRGEVVWRKGEGAAGSCAWGSFRSAANPVLRDTTERVVIASKGRFDRALSRAERERRGLPSVNTIDADEFMAATLDVWDIEPESARRVSHPGAVPGRAPRAPDRPLHLRERSRARSVHGLGLHAGRGGAPRPPLRRLRPRPDLRRHRAPARPRRRARRARAGAPIEHRRSTDDVDEADNFQARATKEGKAAQALAEELLVNTGFKIVAKNKRLPRHRRRRSTSSRPTPTRSSGTSTCRARSRARAAACCAPTRSGRRSGARTCCAARAAGPARVPHVAPAAQGQRGRRRAQEGRRAGRLLRRDRDALGRGLRAAAQVRRGGHSEVPLSGFLA